MPHPSLHNNEILTASLNDGRALILKSFQANVLRIGHNAYRRNPSDLLLEC